MALLPHDFRKRFRAGLLALHWRHWSAFGLSAQESPEARFVLDLEALAVSTLALGGADKRLLTGAREWLTVNRGWVNLNRVKRIGRGFEPLGENVLEELLSHLKKAPAPSIAASRKAGKPNIHSPVLLQLALRGIFGVDARAETMLFLLAKGEGNSNLIARAVHSDQKNIYLILERWTEAGVGAPAGGTSKGFALARPRLWMDLLNLREAPRRVDWRNVYLTLHAVNQACQGDDDEYLLASRFRDLLPQASSALADLGIEIPPQRNHPGAGFFTPFAHTMLNATE